MMFEREMKRYTRHGGREEAAAALSITAEAETVLDRLEITVNALPQNGAIRDQRTGRRWSDDGIKTIARDLVYLAEVQGRLGSEMLTIELSGSETKGLRLDLYTLATRILEPRVPRVRLWRYTPDGDPIEAADSIELELDRLPTPTKSNDDLSLRHHILELELPDRLADLDVDAGDPVYSISLEGDDAPMRATAFADSTELGDRLAIRFTTYRTIASIEIIRSLQ